MGSRGSRDSIHVTSSKFDTSTGWISFQCYQCYCRTIQVVPNEKSTANGISCTRIMQSCAIPASCTAVRGCQACIMSRKRVRCVCERVRVYKQGTRRLHFLPVVLERYE